MSMNFEIVYEPKNKADADQIDRMARQTPPSIQQIVASARKQTQDITLNFIYAWKSPNGVQSWIPLGSTGVDFQRHVPEVEEMLILNGRPVRVTDVARSHGGNSYQVRVEHIQE